MCKYALVDKNMNPNTIPLDIDELAKIIRRRPSSILSDLVRKPESLPPHFKAPGTRKPLWLPSTVENWLWEQARKSNALPSKK